MENGIMMKEIADKIKNNLKYIDNEMREYSVSKDGMYFNNPQKNTSLLNIFSWTNSFFSGMAYWAYKITGDRDILKWMYSKYDVYYRKVFEKPEDTMHDLGFLYSLYAVALYKLTGDINMKKLGVRAADELAKRFVPNGMYIQAWGRMDGEIPSYISEELAQDPFFVSGKGRAIVDCMMNIPLLFWASEVTKHPYYRRVACCNADTVLKCFVREDGSVCHSFLFDIDSGAVVKEANVCGYGNGSNWARGSAWAIYGFAVSYSYTGEEKYLDAAVKICDKFIKECNGRLPIWDFCIPEDSEKNIDTSAAAITMCGIAEILKHREIKEFRSFCDSMEKQILSFVNLDKNINGILAEQNGGHYYASFGDYFLVEYFSMKELNAKRIW